MSILATRSSLVLSKHAKLQKRNATLPTPFWIIILLQNECPNMYDPPGKNLWLILEWLWYDYYYIWWTNQHISDILLTTKNNAMMQSTAKYCEVLYGNAKYCKNSKYSIHLKKQFQLFTLRVFQYRWYTKNTKKCYWAPKISTKVSKNDSHE